jgi:hypothetical protein
MAQARPTECGTGCLPRVSTVGQWAPVYSDYQKAISLRTLDEEIARRKKEQPDWTAKDDIKTIQYQNGRGSCAVDASCAAWRVINNRQNGIGSDVLLNPWQAYKYVAYGGKDQGSMIDVNLKHGREVGYVPEEYFPRWERPDPEDNYTWKIKNDWQVEAPDGWREIAAEHRFEEWYDVNPETRVEEIATACFLGHVAVIGWTGHSELIVDYLGDGLGLVLNSWGKNWNNGGYHVEPLRNVDPRYGAYIVRTVKDRGF